MTVKKRRKSAMLGFLGKKKKAALGGNISEPKKNQPGIGNGGFYGKNR